MKGMNSHKALGLEKFSMAFFQACWDVIKAALWVVSMIFKLEKVSMSHSLLSF